MGPGFTRSSPPKEGQLTKPDVALFMPNFAGGGAERVMINLAGGLQNLGLQVDLVVACTTGPLKERVPPLVNVVDLNARSTIRSLPALTKYLHSAGPDALLSALEHANVVALWAAKRCGIAVRTVVSIHNTLSLDSARGGFKKRLEPWFVRRNYPKADGVVAVSQGVADDFSQFSRLSRELIHVILNPVISAETLAKASENPQHPWFSDGGPPVILGVGRLTEQKDFSMLISAFARLREKRPVRLVIFGEGELRPQLQTQVKSLGLGADISLPGFDPNPYSAMRMAAIVALSSNYEGLPTVLIEGLAAGANMVSTDCPHGPREILHGGKLGRLVPGNDLEKFADAMFSALDEPIRSNDARDWKAYRIDVASRHYAKLLLPGTNWDQLGVTP